MLRVLLSEGEICLPIAYRPLKQPGYPRHMFIHTYISTFAEARSHAWSLDREAKQYATLHRTARLILGHPRNTHGLVWLNWGHANERWTWWRMYVHAGVVRSLAQSERSGVICQPEQKPVTGSPALVPTYLCAAAPNSLSLTPPHSSPSHSSPSIHFTYALHHSRLVPQASLSCVHTNVSISNQGT